jgi:Carboxymuconolactone decarboxylase family
VTVSALIAIDRPDQLRAHLALARTNGVPEEEVAELITHNDVTEIGLVEATNTWSSRTCQGKLRLLHSAKGVLSILSW